MIGFDDARHLLARTGFGATPDDIQVFAVLRREQAADALLNSLNPAASTPMPDWNADSAADLPGDRDAFIRRLFTRAGDIKSWWLREIVVTPSPFTERLTLFWHNHFTSSIRKVKFPSLILRQNALLRRYAAGNYREMVKAAAKDPAMILYLDTHTNTALKPNENFARELFELFTLGEGQYTETDIREAARAFTGWKIDRQTGEFFRNPRTADPGSKTVFGRTGTYDGDDICDMALDRPEAAAFITRKLWREFINESPDERLVRSWSDALYSSNYELKPLLRAMLTSDALYDERNRGRLVKSPVDLVAGTWRVLDLPVDEPRPLAAACRRLGQDVFDPPNVKGWPGGNAWITTATLASRRQFIARAIRGREMVNRTGGETPWWCAPGMDGEAGLEQSRRVLLPLPPVDTPDTGTLAQKWLLDPVYQLK